ncbi:MAG: hypothetical protein JO119_13575 [Acidobacteria bacterium]|nr:hypothetical protein [Acidobacteriota bacterium]
MLTGTRVRFTTDFYITNLLPPRNWAGVITEERKSLTGQPTKFTVRLDEQYWNEALDKEVDAKEDELILA